VEESSTLDLGHSYHGGKSRDKVAAVVAHEGSRAFIEKREREEIQEERGSSSVH
jgi:hypothetical protein